MKIKRLENQVIDQIAAGEVVERPAQMVKELIENSIDAGSTQINIEVSDGGRAVTISDNGFGIESGDLILALSRHCTSKIKESTDLWRLQSYGFRGEALATLAAVTDLELISRANGSPTGHKITAKFGRLGNVDSVSADAGTRVQIKDLFANIPARLKFLKAATAEITQIKNVVKAMAMVNSEVEFRLKANGKMVFFWPATDSAMQRVKQVLDQENMFEGHTQYLGLSSSIYYCSPENTARTGRQIWVFVQGRWVQDRGMQAAVLDSFRSLLMHGEYPIAAVFVECDPQEVDVNIHPAKSQVKFRDSSAAFRVVHRALRTSLEKAPWVTLALKSPVAADVFLKPFEAKPSSFVSQQSELESIEFQGAGFESTNVNSRVFNSRENQPALIQEPKEKYSSQKMSSPFQAIEQTRKSAMEEIGKWGNLQILGQAHLTYILAQSIDRFFFIDQHAAHERVLFERLKRAWSGEKLEVQEFLLPLSVEVEEDLIDGVLKESQSLQKLGISVEAGGASMILVRAAPSVLKESGLERAIQVLATELSEKGGSFAVEKTINGVLSTLACHSAVRAGKALSVPEMQSLLTDMDEFPLSSFCPHGRPVFVEIPFAKLERDFGRIV